VDSVDKVLGCPHLKIHPVVELMGEHHVWEISDVGSAVVVIEEERVKLVCWKCWTACLSRRSALLRQSH
jgi:hypothetical protein